MAEVRRLCVYCDSSFGHESRFREVAAALGQAAARRGIGIVFGGGRVGLMGAVADGALGAGGEVIGIIPEILQDREVGHGGITRLEVVDSMHNRKRRMFELSDAFVALPGGLGTLDETFEIITWKQLQMHDKPVLLLNQDGYWDPLLDMVRHQTDAGFVHPENMELFAAVADIEALFRALDEAPAPRLVGDEKLL